MPEHEQSRRARVARREGGAPPQLDLPVNYVIAFARATKSPKSEQPSNIFGRGGVGHEIFERGGSSDPAASSWRERGWMLPPLVLNAGSDAPAPPHPPALSARPSPPPSLSPSTPRREASLGSSVVAPHKTKGRCGAGGGAAFFLQKHEHSALPTAPTGHTDRVCSPLPPEG
jgi:hypothetical protein